MPLNAATALLVQGLQTASQATNTTSPASSIAVNALTNVKVAKALLPSADTWWVLNVDSGEYVFGQYTTEVQSNVSAAYGDTYSLGRQNPVSQFLHGNLETMAFQGTFFASFAFQEVVKQSQKIQQWARVDPELGRPPVCYFWIGSQYAQMTSCRVQSANIRYEKATKLGQPRGAKISIVLRKYEPFSLDDTANFDTLYYRSKPADSYEKLAARKYGAPILGVELRQRNPKIRKLSPGDVVAMPAPSGSIRRAKIEPKSVALSGVMSRIITPQREQLESKFTTRLEQAGKVLRFSV